MSRICSGPGPDAVDGSRNPLVHAFEELSRSFPAGEGLRAVLERLPRLAASSVEACDEASVTMLDGRGRMTTAAATADVVVDLDNEQYTRGEGPCLFVARGEARSLYSAELAADERWPTFGARAASQGFGSLLSHRFDSGALVGGINFYARRADAFGDADKDAAALLTTFAGVAAALTHERVEATHLREALQSRDTIGQAKGILMERMKVTPDEAFGMLRKASQDLNRKLRDLADELAATGELPTGPP